MGIAKYGPYTHLVKWDEKKAGGRWFECIIAGDRMSDGTYKVKDHEGSEGYYYGDCLTEIGHTPGIGSEVVAYWQNVPWYDPFNYTYAFLATVSAKKPGHFWVKHVAGGDEEWVPEVHVHAVKRM